jgi:hypothetical protein
VKSPLFGLRPAAWIPVALIGAAVVVGGVGLLQLQTSDEPSSPPRLTAAGEAQLDRAADRLAEPGLYVAPAVPLARFSGKAYDEVNARLSGPDVAVRIAVLPASVTRDGQITPQRLTQLLRRRVDAPGVYAVLVDDRGVGSIAAGSWLGRAAADRSPSPAEIDDAVAAGVDEANNCCPGDYPASIEAFIDELESPNSALGSPLLWLAAPGLGLVGLAWWSRRRRPGGTQPPGCAEPEASSALTGLLVEELSEVEYRVAALPQETPGNAQLAGRTAHARYTLAKAKALSHRLARSHPAERDVVTIVGLIADTRRTLHVIEELRLGRPAPAPAPPCFVDPRHGPSRTEGTYQQEGLPARTVPVCAACAAELAVGQRPGVRLLPQVAADGAIGWANYWEAATGAAYVEGYWGEFSFPDANTEADRPDLAAPPQPDPVDLLKLRLHTDRE